MKKFLYKSLLFCSPILMVLAIPTIVLVYSKESFSQIESLVESNEEYLVGYAYDESNYKFLKWKELNYRKQQDIIALGSSRALPFREKMFDVPFYNCGSMISSISDFLPFLRTLDKEKYPKLIIMCLDQWMFNHNWDDLSDEKPTVLEWEKFETNNFTLPTIRNVWKDLLKRKYGLNVFENSNDKLQKRGLNAQLNGKGFTKDGSFFYGSQIEFIINGDPRADDYLFEDTYGRISKGNRRFEKGDNINPIAIQELKAILSFLKSRNISVVAYLPPFADAVNARMKNDGGYTYMEKLYTTLKDDFISNDFELWDLSQLSKYNSNDREVIDGFHGGEVTYLKMLVYMAQQGSVLNQYVTVEQLLSDLNDKKNNLSVY